MFVGITQTGSLKRFLIRALQFLWFKDVHSCKTNSAQAYIYRNRYGQVICDHNSPRICRRVYVCACVSLSLSRKYYINVHILGTCAFMVD